MESFLVIRTKEDFFNLLNEWEASKNSNNISNNEVNKDEAFLTQKQAAKFLKITPATLIGWKKAGKVPYYQQGRTIMFKKSELLSMMEKNQSLIR